MFSTHGVSQAVRLMNVRLMCVCCRRGCGRKRKGTPVKVCDRVFATEDEEESTLVHSYGLEKGKTFVLSLL